MKKLTSGRFLSTVFITSTICAMGLMGKIPPDDMVKLGMIVVTFYFSKGGKNPPGDTWENVG